MYDLLPCPKFRSMRIFVFDLFDLFLIGSFFHFLCLIIFFRLGIAFIRIPRSRGFNIRIRSIFLDVGEIWHFSVAFWISRYWDLLKSILIFIRYFPKRLKFELFLRFIRFHWGKWHVVKPLLIYFMVFRILIVMPAKF